MEYVALFIWLLLCLFLGGMIHVILHNAFEYKVMMWLAAPGLAVRKFAMTAVALVCGATVTEVNVYQVSEHDIGFNGSGIAGASKFLVPVAPLFACALVLQAINAMLGTPLDLSFSPPAIASFDAGGLRGFLTGLWGILAGVVQHVVHADWHSTHLYVLFGFIFSLSLGAGVSFAKFKESILGVVILSVGLMVLCALFGVPTSGASGLLGTSGNGAQFVETVRSFLMSTAGMALVMMLCGVLASIGVGLVVRVIEMVGRSSGVGGTSKSKSKEDDEPAEKEGKRKAA